MNTIGEVNRTAADRNVDNVAARRKNKDLIRENIHLHRVDEIAGIIHIVMPFQKLTYPAQLGIKALIRAGGGLATATLLIAPMRRDTVLADAMHFEGTDLNFQGLSAAAQNGGVQ